MVGVVIRIFVNHSYFVALLVREFFRAQRLCLLRLFLLMLMELLFFFLPLLFVQFCQNVNNLSVLVISAGGANRVGQSRLAAMGAFGERGGAQGMVRPHSIPLPLRMSHSDYHVIILSDSSDERKVKNLVQNVLRCNGDIPTAAITPRCNSVPYPLCRSNRYKGCFLWSRTIMRSRVTFAMMEAAAITGIFSSPLMMAR